MTTPADLTEVEGVRSGVERFLDARLAAERHHYARLGDATGALADATAEMLAGGKRLRPAFCYWSFRAHGGQTETPGAAAALHVGAALELFQAAALFHDDVMDASATRRGRPTAHRVFADRHREAGWTGAPERFGESVAILLGDLALAASETEFSRAIATVEPTVAAGARAVFDEMRTEVTVGQYLDVLAQALPWGADPAADEARAREVIRAKAARYSVEHPLVLGAALAGAPAAALAAVATAGLPLGEAFQLRDDVLGVFGDPAVTGKPAGDDLREGKRTVLVAKAMARGTQTARADIAARLGRRDLTDDDVGQLAESIAQTGALAEVERLIADLLTTGLDRLEAAGLAEPGASMLRRLALAAVERSA